MFKNNILVCLAFCFLSTFSQAATIELVMKKRQVVRLDQGTNDGVTKGAKVCFFDTSDKKLFCAKVSKAVAKNSFVRVKSKKRFNRLKKGFRAEIDSLAGNADVAEGSTSETTNDTTLPHGIRLFSIVTPFTTAAYNKLGYNAPDTATPSNLTTLWTEERSSSDVMTAVTTLMTLAADYRIGLGETSGLILGLRYRTTLEGYTGDFNYTNETTAEAVATFVNITQSFNSTAFYIDYLYYLLRMGENGSMALTTGIDYDITSHKLTANKKTDGGESTTIATVDNKLSILSFRLGTNLNYYFGETFGIGFGLNLLVPMTSFGASDEATVSSDHASALTKDSKEDLIEAVNYQAASFGLETLFSILFDF